MSLFTSRVVYRVWSLYKSYVSLFQQFKYAFFSYRWKHGEEYEPETDDTTKPADGKDDGS